MAKLLPFEPPLPVDTLNRAAVEVKLYFAVNENGDGEVSGLRSNDSCVRLEGIVEVPRDVAAAGGRTYPQDLDPEGPRNNSAGPASPGGGGGGR